MLRFETPLVLQLQDGQLLRWEQPDSAVLRVEEGRIWLTRAHDPLDHFLEAGARFVLRPGEAVLIGAEGRAQIGLSALPGPAAWLLGRLRDAAARWSERHLGGRAAPRLPGQAGETRRRVGA
ncbi:DUF2917 domain-containing protein [Caldimonas tepidiphila]|uniref:DUF2917 domain-containing protein n=1 Tax=Caldimonas tepidiphila TaxID=2315841 RepID=UPI0013005E88|nr:DUF2917 domain-containing protein [Caldimonas tepidiphila]